MRTAFELRDLLEKSGALRRGHFRLSSGLHSADYVQCALLLELPRRARRVGAALASLLTEFEASSVVAPALGGLIIGHEVAAVLDVPFRFAERRSGRMTLRRGFRLEPGSRVLVVEDVVTTGRSTLETVAVVEKGGGEVVAVGAIIDRTDPDVDLGLPFRALERRELETYASDACPLCRQGVPLSRPGSRAKPDELQPNASR